MILFHSLTCYISYFYFYQVIYVYKRVYQNTLLTYFLILWGLFFEFQIFFNYYMAHINGPGNPKDIPGLDMPNIPAFDPNKNDFFDEIMDFDEELEAEYVVAGAEEEEKEEETFETSSLNHRNNSPHSHHLHKKIKNCKLCQCYKPDRCHHCSACNKCVLKMDHHCPWVNNCVGHYNQRYFLHFCLYLLLAVWTLNLLLWHYNSSEDFIGYRFPNSRAYYYAKSTSWIVGLIMIGFNAWNWYLALSG